MIMRQRLMVALHLPRPTIPDLFAAFQRQLGLKLEPTRAPVTGRPFDAPI
jgi:hypothetical protein